MARSFGEWFRFQLLLIRIRDIDRELSDLMRVAWDSDTREDWGRVHDRLNVLGEFAHADRVRELCDRPEDDS